MMRNSEYPETLKSIISKQQNALLCIAVFNVKPSITTQYFNPGPRISTTVFCIQLSFNIWIGMLKWILLWQTPIDGLIAASIASVQNAVLDKEITDGQKEQQNELAKMVFI